jgi:hypothetical protein
LSTAAQKSNPFWLKLAKCQQTLIKGVFKWFSLNIELCQIESKVMTKSKVDNSGVGNCMYYAYGISLMYFLQAKKDSHTTNIVFDNLKLNSVQKDILQALLSKDEDFSLEDIEQIIEPILGPANRILGAERTRQEFLEKPDNSPIFSSANYGIEYEFIRLLDNKDPLLAALVTNDFKDRNYIDAEVYNVRGIRAGMQDFAIRQVDDLLLKFQQRWESKLESLTDKSDENLTFQSSEILDSIIREKTIEFFKENDNTFLNKYIDMLNTNFVWGSEETMMALHREVTGEKMTRNPITSLIETTYDTEIPLILYRNGIRAVDNTSNDPPDPVMILNNLGNVHWVSLVQLNSNNLEARKNKERVNDENFLSDTSIENVQDIEEVEEEILTAAPINPSTDPAKDTTKEDETLAVALINPSTEPAIDTTPKDETLAVALINPSTEPAIDTTQKDETLAVALINPATEPAIDTTQKNETLAVALINPATEPAIDTTQKDETLAVALINPSTEPAIDTTQKDETLAVALINPATEPAIDTTQKDETLAVALINPSTEPANDARAEDETMAVALINTSPLSINDRKKKEIIDTSARNSEQNIRKNILYLTGFTTNLNAIKEKADELEQYGHTSESKLAKELFKDLQGKMNEFISTGTENSRETDIQIFANSCTPFVTTAKSSELANHRGIKGILNAIMNFMVSICTLGLINWNLGKLTIVEPFTTKSINKINELHDSVVKVSEYSQSFFVAKENNNMPTPQEEDPIPGVNNQGI